MTAKYRIALSLALIVAPACKNNNDLQGDPPHRGETKTNTDNNALPTDFLPTTNTSVDVIRPTDCNENGGTVATFLTQSISNNVGSQQIQIRIKLATCDGKVQSLRGKTLLFDTTCSVSDVTTGPAYTVKTDDATARTLFSGRFSTAEGDLWKKNRSPFYYYYTPAFSDDVSSAILTVSLGGRSITCGDAGSSGAKQAPFLFQVGDAAPTIQNITVLGS